MFRRVLLENWHSVVPYIAFGTTAFLFLLMCARGVFLKREKAQRMSNIPLDD